MSEQVLNTVSFAGRAANSSQFKALYTEGMSLLKKPPLTLMAPVAQHQRSCRALRQFSMPLNPCVSPRV